MLPKCLLMCEGTATCNLLPPTCTFLIHTIVTEVFWKDVLSYFQDVLKFQNVTFKEQQLLGGSYYVCVLQ